MSSCTGRRFAEQEMHIILAKVGSTEYIYRQDTRTWCDARQKTNMPFGDHKNNT